MITRRGFLGAMITGMAMGRNTVFGENNSNSIVYLAESPTETAIKRLMESSEDFSRHVTDGSRVLIKPNLSWPNPPDWATTTNPTIVRSMVEYCAERNAASILIADHTIGRAEVCEKLTEAKSVTKDVPQARLLFLGRPRDFIPRELPESSQLKRIEIAKELLRATVVINIPVAKAHSATSVSFGMKNLMGLVKDRRAFHTSADIHRAIAEILHVIKPDITILDATRVLASKGPQGPGTVETPGIIAASTDPVAVDAYGCSLTRWDGRALNPEDVGHIVHAHALGFGRLDYQTVEV